MWLLLCVVVLARAALAQPSVGVCVVSTGRDYDSGNSTEGLGRIATLFASLSGQGVRRCLVSDFRVHAAAAAATLRRVDADAAVDDWFDVKTPAELEVPSHRRRRPPRHRRDTFVRAGASAACTARSRSG